MYGEQDADWREDFRTLVANFVRHSPSTGQWDAPAIVREAATWADLMADERRRMRGLTAVGLAQPIQPADRPTLPQTKAPPKKP